MVAPMQRILDRLRAMDRSAAWLGRQLTPPTTRQAIADWERVPHKRADQVAALLGLTRDEVRPNLPVQNTSDVHQQA